MSADLQGVAAALARARRSSCANSALSAPALMAAPCACIRPAASAAPTGGANRPHLASAAVITVRS